VRSNALTGKDPPPVDAVEGVLAGVCGFLEWFVASSLVAGAMCWQKGTEIP
jgi:hypothetical protein